MRDLSILGAAREWPDRACLIAPGERLSYAETARRTRIAIAWLKEQGVRSPDTRVALTPHATIDSAILVFALLELGAPIVLLHPRWTDAERASVVERTAPTLVLGTDARAPTYLSAPIEDPALNDAAGCLAIIHTSGSTDEPKGVVLSRRAFLAAAEASADNLGWKDGDRWLLCLPPAHVGGLSVLIRCLVSRTTVVVAGRQTFDAASVAALIEDEQVTITSLVPTMLRPLVDEFSKSRVPSSLRAVLVGGAALPSLLRERAARLGVPVVATYGCTEACSQITTQRIEHVGLEGCGTPLPGIEVRLAGSVIEVRGPTMMDGYLGHPAPRVFDRDGWFRTGDLGEFADDGQLLVLGRADDMIVTGGENVSPAQVEAVLASVPGVKEACVFGVPDEVWGQRVVAALGGDASLDRDALRRHLAEALSDHARPKELCVVDELPTTPLGKLDRQRVLREFVANLEPL